MTTIRMIRPPAATSLVVFIASAGMAMGADTDPKPEQKTMSVTASLEDQFDYDSNPHLSTKRYQPANQYQADYLNDAVARIRMEFPRVPLILKGRVVDDAYTRQHVLDTTVTSGQLQLPINVSDEAEIAPGYRREDQWYDGHYFQADDRADARWTQDWSRTVSTSIDPFYSVLTHPTAFKAQDGYEYGVDLSIDLVPLDDLWLSAVTITCTPERYDATTRHVGYHQLDAGIDLALDLPGAFHALINTDVIAATYNGIEPGRQELRHDRIVTCDITISRDLVSHLSAEGICEMTRTTSNLRAYTFNEVIAGLGLKWSIQ